MTGIQEVLADRDLVERIVDYIAAECPEILPLAEKLKAAARNEFRGNRAYIPRRSEAERERIAQEVLSHFNGRNASEVARRLNISRASVYRIIKTGGR